MLRTPDPKPMVHSISKDVQILCTSTRRRKALTTARETKTGLSDWICDAAAAEAAKEEAKEEEAEESELYDVGSSLTSSLALFSASAIPSDNECYDYWIGFICHFLLVCGECIANDNGEDCQAYLLIMNGTWCQAWEGKAKSSRRLSLERKNQHHNNINVSIV